MIITSKKILAVLVWIVYFVIGFIYPTAFSISFTLMTNSSKGWNVNDPDGELFVPLGIAAFLICVFVAIWQIYRLIKMHRKGGFIKKTAFVQGVIVNIITTIL